MTVDVFRTETLTCGEDSAIHHPFPSPSLLIHDPLRAPDPLPRTHQRHQRHQRRHQRHQRASGEPGRNSPGELVTSLSSNYHFPRRVYKPTLGASPFLRRISCRRASYTVTGANRSLDGSTPVPSGSDAIYKPPTLSYIISSYHGYTRTFQFVRIRREGRCSSLATALTSHNDRARKRRPQILPSCTLPN